MTVQNSRQTSCVNEARLFNATSRPYYLFRSLCHHIHANPGTHPTLHPVGIGSFLSGGKVAGVWSYPVISIGWQQEAWNFNPTSHMPSFACWLCIGTYLLLEHQPFCIS